jgi:ribonuclease HI
MACEEDRYWPNRLADPCPTREPFTPAQNIRQCHDSCGGFFRYCCQHDPDHEEENLARTCHQFRIIMTDGACSSNGQVGAVSGLGVVGGVDKEEKWSIHITDEVDPTGNGKRTSQRAELLGAIYGIMMLRKVEIDFADHLRVNRYISGEDRKARRKCIVTTDSEYVVKGMTEWMPKWRVSFIFWFSKVALLTGHRKGIGVLRKVYQSQISIFFVDWRMKLSQLKKTSVSKLDSGTFRESSIRKQTIWQNRQQRWHNDVLLPLLLPSAWFIRIYS